MVRGLFSVALALSFPTAVLLSTSACKSNAGPSEADRDAKFARELKDAQSRLDSDSLEAADTVLKRLYAQRPDSPELTVLMGELAFKRNDYVTADKLLTQAAGALGQNVDVHRLLGQVRQADKRHTAAAEAYRRAFELDPERSELGLALGRALLDAGKAADAEKVLRDVAKLDPEVRDANSVGVHTLLGDALRAQNKPDLAIESYMTAQTTFQSDKMAFAGAAFAYEEKDDIKHALDQWSNYVQRDCCSDYSRQVAQKKIATLKE